MNKFNCDVDKIFADFNKYGDANECRTQEVRHEKGENKCQITHIVDSEECICYAIDINR